MKLSCLIMLLSISVLFAEDLTLPVPSGVAVHLAADKITGLNDGDPVSIWQDSSGNGNHAVQSVADNRATYVLDQLNGKAIVRFEKDDSDGADWLSISSTADLDGADKTWFIVAKQQDLNTLSDEFILRSDYSGQSFYWGTDTSLAGNIRSSAIVNGFKSVNQPNIAGEFHIVATIWDCVEGTMKQYLNGQASSQVVNVFDSQTRSHTKTYIGGDSTGSRYFDGDIAEIIIYNRPLTKPEIVAVGKYLEYKYGIHTDYAFNKIYYSADLNKDGFVDLNDLCQLIENLYMHDDNEFTGEDICWTAPMPDTSRSDDAGYPLVFVKQDVEIYHAALISEGGMGTYNHGPHMIYHQEKFYVTWKSHDEYEDAPGQRTLCSVSSDGINWSDPIVVVDSISSMGPRDEVGYFTFAAPFQAVSDRLYAFSSLNRREGSGYAYLGKVCVQVDSDGQPVTNPIWMASSVPSGAPSACDGYDLLGDLSGQLRDDLEIIEERWDTLQGDSWNLSNGSTLGPAPGTPDCRLSEHTSYFTKGNIHQVTLWRDEESFSLWASVRQKITDSTGKIITDYGYIYPTNIPDPRTWNYALNLPDGQACVIGSHYPERLHRWPLTVAISSDGLDFNCVWAIRTGTVTMRYSNDTYKCSGYQYPAAIVVGDDLWISYSVNKEDIAITRVPLKCITIE